MTGIFKANNPYNTFLLFVYGLLLKLPMFLHPVIPTVQKTDGFLFKALLNQLGGVGKNVPAIYPIITFLLLYNPLILAHTHTNNVLMIKGADKIFHSVNKDVMSK